MKADKLDKKHCIFCGSPAFRWTPAFVKKSVYSRLHVVSNRFPAVSFSKDLVKYPLCEMHSAKAISHAAEIEFDKDAEEFVQFRQQSIYRICELAKLICKESGDRVGTKEYGDLVNMEVKLGRATTKVPRWLHLLSLSHPDSRDRCMNPIEGVNECLEIGDPVFAAISQEKFADFITETIKKLALRVADENKGKPGGSVGPYRCSAAIKTQPDGRCTNFTHSKGAYCKRCEKTPGVYSHDRVEPGNLEKIISIIDAML